MPAHRSIPVLRRLARHAPDRFPGVAIRLWCDHDLFLGCEVYQSLSRAPRPRAVAAEQTKGFAQPVRVSRSSTVESAYRGGRYESRGEGCGAIEDGDLRVFPVRHRGIVRLQGKNPPLREGYRVRSRLISRRLRLTRVISSVHCSASHSSLKPEASTEETSLCFSFLEDGYFRLDPFADRRRPLFIGADCNLCSRPVCGQPTCSLFYTRRFCARCAKKHEVSLDGSELRDRTALDAVDVAG